jgi:hypothetical protein
MISSPERSVIPVLRRILPILFLSILALAAPLFAVTQTIYVRTDGSDAACSGLDDRAAGIQDPNCSEATIAAALTDVADGDGDTIKLKSGQRFNASVTITSADPNLTITATDPNGPKPIIGGGALYFETGNNWTLDPGTTQDANTGSPLYIYRSDPNQTAPQIGGNGSITSGAYITNISDYENGRVGLIPYRSSNPDGTGLLGWLRASGEAFSTSDAFYRGPGIIWDGSRYYISLRGTQDLSNYEGALSPIFAGDFDPDNYDINIGTAAHTLRIEAENVTIQNVQLDPAAKTVVLGNTGSVLAADPNEWIIFDEVTVWSGSSGAIVTNENATSINKVTIRNSQIYGDVPYWVSWHDCKTSPAPCDQWRHTLIAIGRDGNAAASDVAANDWVITKSHIRGGHDGIGIDGDANGIDISYNRIENFADDPFEIELDASEVLGDVNILGNYIANSHNCFSVMQQSVGTWTGPINYYHNVCALIRPAHNDSAGTCATTSWYGGFCYGNEYAFKWGHESSTLTDHNTHLWNNTFILSLSHPDKGFNIVGGVDDDTVGKHGGDYLYNNIFVKVNDRVGEQYRWTSHNFTEVDNNLYFSMNMKDITGYERDLLGAWNTVADACLGDPNTECSGLGANADANTGTWGTNPLFETTNGFGCFVNQTCAGFDKSNGVRWSPYLASTFWRPSAFVLESNSPACDAGRGSDPGGFPTGTVDPNGAIANDPNDMGAIPCGATASVLDYEPMTFDWPCTDTAVNAIPAVTITSPTRKLVNTFAGLTQDFCATITDPDGHGPYTYLWDFTGTGCPADNTGLCPGAIAFNTPATCSVVFRVTDRCGVQSALPPTLPDGTAGYHARIYVRSGMTDSGSASTGCSDCRRCICDRVN